MKANAKAAFSQSDMAEADSAMTRFLCPKVMAKALLNAKVSQPSPTIVRITLAHGVDYGIWLELAHEKNYAIIAPTVREEGPRIVSDLDNLMSKLKL